MKHVAIGILALVLSVLVLVEFRVVDRVAYQIESGRMRAVRDGLGEERVSNEAPLVGRLIAESVMPAVVSIETESRVIVVQPDGEAGTLPNVHWLGERDYTTLPAYLRCFDAGLIPFRHVPLTHNANPIKLYEYLAAGVPVVSTALPSVQPVANSVWLADDIARMTVCCRRALQHNTPEERLARSELIKTESWSARIEKLSEIVAASRSTQPVAETPAPVEATTALQTAAPAP